MERFFASIMKKRKIYALFEIGRPWNGIVLGLIALIGFFLVSVEPHLSLSLGVFFCFLLTYMAGATLNDICDVKIDMINLPYRPLQRGAITVREATLFALLLYSASLLLSFILNFQLFVGIVILTALSIAYSYPPIAMERRGLLGNITLGFVTVFIPAFTGAWVAVGTFNLPWLFWIAILFFTLFTSFLLIIKDFKDLIGDRIKGKKTFAVAVGRKTAFYISLAGIAVFFPITIFLFGLLLGNFWLFYLISIILFITLFLIEIKNIRGTRLSDERMFTNIRVIFLLFVLFILVFAIIG